MRDYRTLQLLDKCSGWFTKFGIDYKAMRHILQVKLTLDARTSSFLLANTKSSGEKQTGANKEKNQFIRSLWFYCLFGVITSPLIYIADNYLFQMSIFFGIFTFMLLTILISSFSSILLDVRDRTILFSKPVDKKTIAMAKTMHVSIYMLFLTGSIALVPLGVGLYRHGILFFLLMLLCVVLIDLFTVVLTALIYLLVLRFFDGEKLKDMINYVQIGLTVGITVGYQLLIRLFGVVDMAVVFQSQWWQFLIPPIWFAALFETTLNGVYDPLFILFSLLAIVIPILSFIIYLKFLPTLERYVQKLAAPSGVDKSKNKLAKLFAKLSCRNLTERVFFQFIWTMIKKERKFKLKVYPSLGLSLVFPFIFLFSPGFGGSSNFQGSPMFLLIYFCAMFIPTVIIMIQYSEKHKGAWIYEITPVQDEAVIYKSMIKASFLRLIAPVFLLVSCVMMYLFGIVIVPDLISVLLSLFLYTVLTFMYFEKSLPFSKPFGVGESAEGVKVVPIMLVAFLIALIHFAFLQVIYGTYLYMAVVIALNWVAWNKGFNKDVLLRGVKI